MDKKRLENVKINFLVACLKYSITSTDDLAMTSEQRKSPLRRHLGSSFSSRAENRDSIEPPLELINSVISDFKSSFSRLAELDIITLFKGLDSSILYK